MYITVNYTMCNQIKGDIKSTTQTINRSSDSCLTTIDIRGCKHGTCTAPHRQTTQDTKQIIIIVVRLRLNVTSSEDQGSMQTLRLQTGRATKPLGVFLLLLPFTMTSIISISMPTFPLIVPLTITVSDLPQPLHKLASWHNLL